MIRTITRAITRPITRAIRRAFEKTRYLIDLNGTNAYYELAQPIAFTGDFEIECEFSVDEITTTWNVLFHLGVYDSSGFVLYVNNGRVYFFASSGNSLSTTTTVNAGALNRCNVSYVGGELTLTVNDEVVSVNLSISASSDKFYIGVRSNGSADNFNGIIANVKFTDLGSQLFSTFTSLDAGSSYSAGVLTLVQNAGQDFAVSDVSITNGTKYTIDYEVTSQDIDTDGELKVTTSVGNTTKVLLPHTVGEHSVTFTADANYTMTLRLGNTSNGRVVVGDSWSVRETDNIVTTTFALDEPTANTELSVESGGLATTGEELVVNGGFSDGTNDWSPLSSSSLSVVLGALRITNVGVNFGKGYQDIVTVAGAKYTFTFDGVNSSSASRFVRVGTVAGGTDVMGQMGWDLDANTFSFVALTTSTFLTFSGDNVDEGFIEIDNISIKLASPSITYNNISEADRELYQEVATEFVNISPAPQQLPATITKA